MDQHTDGEHAGLYVERRVGKGSHTLLLLHGGGVAGWMWRPLCEALDIEMSGSCDVLVPDLPGHDRSAEVEYRSHDQVVRLLIAVLEREGVAAVTVVGFSLGAQLAVLLAVARPDLVQRVVVVSAQAKPTPLPSLTLGLLAIAAPLAKFEWFARAQAKELWIGPDLFADYLRTSRTISRATLLNAVGENLRFSPPDGWRSFAGASLVLVGEQERGIMRESARLLAQMRADGDAEFVRGCGHGIPLQRPDLLAIRVREMLNS